MIDGTIGTKRSKLAAVSAAAERHRETLQWRLSSLPESCGSLAGPAFPSVSLESVGLGADRFEII
jgi:hypothetical protein